MSNTHDWKVSYVSDRRHLGEGIKILYACRRLGCRATHTLVAPVPADGVEGQCEVARKEKAGE